MARKLGLELKEADIPPLAFKGPVSGNELEGLLVRAIRRYELQDAGAGQAADRPGGGTAASSGNVTAARSRGTRTLPQILKQVAAEFRPSAHTLQLELMDLLAVRECTDECFLPPRFRSLDRETVERRISELQEG
jgi:hypothetical protein